MKKSKRYYHQVKSNPLNSQNLEENSVIHELEKKELEINIEKLEGKQALNELR
ncbi:MAG: hypothetical protein JJT76_14405 [Clostridiaceae bacterium]|nr:hypothetical protein [Clostridiaceae bacterium]